MIVRVARGAALLFAVVASTTTLAQSPRPSDGLIGRWDLVYKVYEPVGYFAKLRYLLRNLSFYAANFERVGGIKLAAKYLLSNDAFEKLKRTLSPT